MSNLASGSRGCEDGRDAAPELQSTCALSCTSSSESSYNSNSWGPDWKGEDDSKSNDDSKWQEGGVEDDSMWRRHSWANRDRPRTYVEQSDPWSNRSRTLEEYEEKRKQNPSMPPHVCLQHHGRAPGRPPTLYLPYSTHRSGHSHRVHSSVDCRLTRRKTVAV